MKISLSTTAVWHLRRGIARVAIAAAAIAFAFFARPVWAARGGEPQPSGGRAPNVGGGGGGHVNVGHAPTFSAPHTSRPQESRPNISRPEFSRPNISRPENTRPNVSRPEITRPNISRPDITRPNNSRPDFTRPNNSRPNVSRPELGKLPDFAKRLPIEGRPDVVGRPGFDKLPQNRNDFFGRPGFNTRPGLAVRPSYVNRRDDFNRRPGYVAGRNPLLGNWYHGDWHRDWRGGQYRWYGRPAWWWGNNWWGAGYLPGYSAWTIPWNWGYWSYYNPYYTAPLTFGTTVVNYSQPIVLQTPPAGVAQTDAEDQAMQFFDSARDAFMNGQYKQALTQTDQAIALLPSDSVLHEFRGLVLFALGDYRQSAASIYAALSVGPGWDWTTLSGFYPDSDAYTQQLRTLEQYIGAHPDQSDARFVLAYQYLTCGYTDQAVTQLQDVVQLNPRDQLSAQLLASLTNPQTAMPDDQDQTGAPSQTAGAPPAPPGASPAEPTAPSAPAAPVNSADLAGRWTATRPDGGTVTLNLGGDSKYDWNFTANGQTHNFGGNYSVADNLLILKQGDTPSMVGQVTMVNNRQFNFKMPGGNPNDPGLTFSRG